MRGYAPRSSCSWRRSGLGAYLYFVDAKKPVAEENAKQKVFAADATKIDQLEVKSASGEVTVAQEEDAAAGPS